jgi:prevent-host-death family protein
MEIHTMRSLSIRQVRAALSDLENLVEQEGELLITRHGKPVAKIVAVQPRKKLPSHKAFRATMPFQEIPSQFLIREDRDGR